MKFVYDIIKYRMGSDSSMDALDNKCPACGASIVFNPSSQMWDCEYCASKFTLEQIQHQSNNADTQESNVIDQMIPESSGGDMDVYKCKNCGAEIMADQTTTATFCVYCGSTAILKDKILQGRVPNYIIPFKTVKEDAILGFNKLIKGKILVPKEFKDSKNIEKITGIYIPFWGYDLEANGEVEFEASDIKTWSNSKYKYRKVDRYSIRKSGHFDFNKVLADASSRFSNDLMDSLEPFNYDELAPYNHAYLSGFLADKYDVDEADGLKRVSGRTNATAVSLMQETVGHSEQKVINNGIRVSARYTYYIMLPVWLLNIKYNNKTYTFAMNGQTGKVIGNFPIGIKETAIWSIIFFAILFILGILYVLFFM